MLPSSPIAARREPIAVALAGRDEAALALHRSEQRAQIALEPEPVERASACRSPPSANVDDGHPRSRPCSICNRSGSNPSRARGQSRRPLPRKSERNLRSGQRAARRRGIRRASANRAPVRAWSSRACACGCAALPISTRPSVSVGVGSRRTSIAPPMRTGWPASLRRLAPRRSRDTGSSRRNAARPAPLPAPG